MELTYIYLFKVITLGIRTKDKPPKRRRDQLKMKSTLRTNSKGRSFYSSYRLNESLKNRFKHIPLLITRDTKDENHRPDNLPLTEWMNSKSPSRISDTDKALFPLLE
jgi:hypothetical protein